MRQMRLLILVVVALAVGSHGAGAVEPTNTAGPTSTMTSGRATQTPIPIRPTRTPRNTRTPAEASTATPAPTATMGTIQKEHSHVTALEETILLKDADLPRYSDDCIQASYQPKDKSQCRCVVFVERIAGTNYLKMRCPDGSIQTYTTVQQ